MAMTTDEFRSRLRELVGEYAEGQADREWPAEVCRATAIEDAAMAVGDAVTQELMSQQLTVAGEEWPCPTCGGRCLHKGERRRDLQSRRGEVEFREPELYCSKCRRSFFPSLRSVGPGG